MQSADQSVSILLFRHTQKGARKDTCNVPYHMKPQFDVHWMKRKSRTHHVNFTHNLTSHLIHKRNEQSSNILYKAQISKKKNNNNLASCMSSKNYACCPSPADTVGATRGIIRNQIKLRLSQQSVVRLYHVISFLRMSTYRSISADYSQLAL